MICGEAIAPAHKITSRRATHRVAYARRAAILDDDALHLRPSNHPRIAALHGGGENRLCWAHPAAPIHAALGVGNALLRAAAVVRVARNAKRLRAAHKRIAQRISRINISDRKRPAGAMKARIAGTQHVLALDEIGQHILITPAAITGRSPRIKICPLATVVDMPVDRPRATERLATRRVNRAPRCIW